MTDSLVVRLAIIATVIVVGAATALWRRRRSDAAPTQPRFLPPTQLDRDDFAHGDRPWLVVSFTSATCSTCADIAAKVAVLDSSHVAVQIVEYSANRELHARYNIDAVPTVVIADAAGVVQWARIGPSSATDLWAAVARLRDPSLPASSCSAHESHSSVHEMSHETSRDDDGDESVGGAPVDVR